MSTLLTTSLSILFSASCFFLTACSAQNIAPPLAIAETQPTPIPSNDGVITIAAVGDIMLGSTSINDTFLPPNDGRDSLKAVTPILAAADIAVVPSVHDEAGNVDGLPNTALEIMASGTPLVATPVGGIGAVATDGETARLVPERDGAALAGVIAELIDHPEQRRALGERSRQVAMTEYSWSRTTERFTRIYERVLDHPHAS